MNIALVVPNFRWCEHDENTLWHYIPYNLCLLAAMVDDLAEVTIIDAYKDDLTPKGYEDALKRCHPDIVGITALFDQYGSSGHKAAKIAKRQGAKIVMGGVYATTNPLKVMADSNIDYLVIGEGEYVFRQLVKDYVAGILKRRDVFKAERITDLDALPLPAYHLLDMEKYINSAERKSVDSPRVYPYARIMTSRGCPMNCCFCQVKAIAGQEFRYRSPENVLDEIEWLRDIYGIKSLIFDDDNILHDKKRAIAIFQGMIDKGLAMPWLSIGLAVFKLDKDLLTLMRKSGCEYIAVAIESGTQRVLKQIIQKPVNFDYATELVKVARSLGIYVAANFIVGFPTETWDEIRQTIKMAEAIGTDYSKIFHAVPLPKTRLWDLCLREKAFGNDGHFVWSKGNIETDQFSSNDLTVLRAYEWDRINFSDPNKRELTRKMMGVTEEELNKIRRDTLVNACHLIGAK